MRAARTARASWKGQPADANPPTSAPIRIRGYHQTRSTACKFSPFITTVKARRTQPGEEGSHPRPHSVLCRIREDKSAIAMVYSDDHNTVVADVKACYIYPVQGVSCASDRGEIPPSAKNAGGGGHPSSRAKSRCRRRHGDREPLCATTRTHLLQAGLREVLASM